MQPVSDEFLAAISASHQMCVKLEVYNPSSRSIVFTAEQTPTSVDPVRITGGEVTLSKSADIRSQATVQIVDPTFQFVPTSPADVFAPYGNQLRLYRGVAFADGTREYVRLCTCRISQVQITERDGGLMLNITAQGLEREVARNVIAYFWPPTSMVSFGGKLALVDSGNNPVPPNETPFYTDFISVLISDRFPDVEFNTSSYSTSAVLPFDTPSNWAWAQYVGIGMTTRLSYAASLNLSQGANPWQQAKSAADLMGSDLYFDRFGVCTLVRDPNLLIMDQNFTGTPVARFIEGETATFLNVDRTLSDEDGFNACVVTGDGSSLVGPVQTPFFQDIDNSYTFPAVSPGGPHQYGVGDNYNQMTSANPGELFVNAASFASFTALPGYASANAGFLYVKTPSGPLTITYTSTGSFSFHGAVTQPEGAPPSVPILASDAISTAFAANSVYVAPDDQRLGFPVTYDDDPNSPTYFFGPYGKVTKVVNNTLVFSSDVARSYSETLLKRSLGTQEQVAFDNICNPALDVDDVIQIQRTRAGLAGNTLYVIDSVTIPLTAEGTQNVKLRERRALSI